MTKREVSKEFRELADEQRREIFDLANEVCRDLPPGYVLSIEMECGAGWVDLHDPAGNKCDTEEFNTYEGIAADVRKAIEYAQQQSAELNGRR